MNALSLLFVCAGNICRSPMAEGMARDIVARRYPESAGSVTLGSAGTIALDGNPPTPEAVEAMGRRGVDITGHRARRLTAEVLEGVDLVLAAEAAQERYVRAVMPGPEAPAVLLGALGAAADRAGRRPGLHGLAEAAAALEREADPLALASLEIDDPVGMSLAEYLRVADSMAGPIEAVLDYLLAG